MHKLVLFKAVDELEPGRQLLLEGQNKFVAFPTSCDSIPKTVHVTRVGQRPSVVGCGSSGENLGSKRASLFLIAIIYHKNRIGHTQFEKKLVVRRVG